MPAEMPTHTPVGIPKCRRTLLLAQASTWGVLVVLPMSVGALSMAWISLCKLFYLIGAFLALPAIPFAALFGSYSAPVARWIPGTCFSDALLGDMLPAPLPCDAMTWLAIAAFYGLAALLLGMVAGWLVVLWQTTRHNAQD